MTGDTKCTQGVAPCPQDAIKETLYEDNSSVKIRVLSPPHGGISQQDEEVDLKFIQCGFESHYPYHKGANSKYIKEQTCNLSNLMRLEVNLYGFVAQRQSNRLLICRSRYRNSPGPPSVHNTPFIIDKAERRLTVGTDLHEKRHIGVSFKGQDRGL